MENMSNDNNIKNKDVNQENDKEMLMALKEVEEIMNNPDKYKGYKDIDELRRALLSGDKILS